MPTSIASVTWAVASILTRTGLADFRPDAAGGDTFLETWPPTEVDDNAILIRTETTSTEYGVEGYNSIISIIIRGELNSQVATQARANMIYYTLLQLAAPSVEVAGNGMYLTICGSWPVPPMVNVNDPSGRPQSTVMLRASHTEPAQPAGSPAFFPIYTTEGWTSNVTLTIRDENGLVDTMAGLTTCTIYASEGGAIVETLTCTPAVDGIVVVNHPDPNNIPAGTYWYEITFDSDGVGVEPTIGLLQGTWRVREV